MKRLLNYKVSLRPEAAHMQFSTNSRYFPWPALRLTASELPNNLNSFCNNVNTPITVESLNDVCLSLVVYLNVTECGPISMTNITSH